MFARIASSLAETVGRVNLSWVGMSRSVPTLIPVCSSLVRSSENHVGSGWRKSFALLGLVVAAKPRSMSSISIERSSSALFRASTRNGAAGNAALEAYANWWHNPHQRSWIASIATCLSADTIFKSKSGRSYARPYAVSKEGQSMALTRDSNVRSSTTCSLSTNARGEYFCWLRLDPAHDGLTGFPPSRE